LRDNVDCQQIYEKKGRRQLFEKTNDELIVQRNIKFGWVLISLKEDLANLIGLKTAKQKHISNRIKMDCKKVEIEGLPMLL